MFKYQPEPDPTQASLENMLKRAKDQEDGGAFSVSSYLDIRACRRLAFQGRLHVHFANCSASYYLPPFGDALAMATRHAVKYGPKSLDNLGAFLRLRFPYMAQPYLDSVAAAALVDAEAAQDTLDAQAPAVHGFQNIIAFLGRDTRRTRPAQPSLAELLADPDGFIWVPGRNLMRIGAAVDMVADAYGVANHLHPKTWSYHGPKECDTYDPDASAAIHVGPARERCPDCNGSGMALGIVRGPGEFIHGGDYHECYTCEGLGEVAPSAQSFPLNLDDASTAEPA